MTYGLGSQVFDSNVTLGDVGVQFVKDATRVAVTEDTVDKTNNTPMPNAMFIKDAAGDYVPVDSLTGLPVEQLTPNRIEGQDGVDVTELKVNTAGEASVIDAGTIAALTAIIAQLPATLGQKVSAASMAVALSSEQEAKIDTLISHLAPKDIVQAIYHDSGITAITQAGTTVGAVGVAVKALTVLNNANAVRVDIGGELAGVSLPGSPLSVDVTTVSGNIVLTSLVGTDITGGDFAINIEG